MPRAAARRIIGLVDAQGAGGIRGGGSAKWSLAFNLAGWREPGSAVVVEGRRCVLPVSERQIEPWMERVKPYSIVEVEVARRTKDGMTHLRRIVQVGVSDSELRQVVARLRKPIVVEVEALGRLRYNRKFGWFEGKAKWCGKAVKLCLSCPDPESPSRVLEAASRLFREQARWHRRVGDYAAEQLLPLLNRSRREEGGRELTARQFVSRMKLFSIDVDESGDFSFWHGDGGLFFDHLIRVSGDLSRGLTDFDTPG